MMFKVSRAAGPDAPTRLGPWVRHTTIVRHAITLAVAGALLSATAVLAGNGAQTAHFTASYSSFTCAGVRIVKSAPKAFIKDSETCTITDLTEFPPGNYTIVGQAVPESSTESHWASDYDILNTPAGSPGCIPGPPVCFRVAKSGSIVVTDNGDGTGRVAITAYY
jgi:hypothetical protein